MVRCLVIGWLLVSLIVGMSSSVVAQTDTLAPCAEPLAHYTPIVGTTRYPVPADLLLPEPRVAFIDPTFGTCLVRVTDRLNDFDSPQVNLKNEYSRLQSFNADDSLIMVHGGKSGDWFLYDAQTLRPIQMSVTNAALGEPRWDVEDPYRFTFNPWWDADTRLMAADLMRSGDQFDVRETVLHDFSDELPPEWHATTVWHRWKGSPSQDGRTDAFMAEDADFVTRGLVSYDVQNDAILGLYTVPHAEDNEPNTVGMSPSGDYVMAEFECCPEGQSGTYDEPCGAVVYTRDLSTGWGIARCPGHGDMAWDAQGHEVIVYQETSTDQIVMTDLATGETTALLELDFSGGSYGIHISGQAHHQPGWVAVSVHPEGISPDWSNPFWMVGTIVALELTANPRVVQLAHHHTLRDEAAEDGGYFAEAHVTVNRDFTRLLFSSNWDQAFGTNEVDMYLVVLPDDWIERLP